jgi:hypothetical protein
MGVQNPSYRTPSLRPYGNLHGVWIEPYLHLLPELEDVLELLRERHSDGVPNLHYGPLFLDGLYELPLDFNGVVEAYQGLSTAGTGIDQDFYN